MKTQLINLAESVRRVLGWILACILLGLLFVNSRTFDRNHHDQIVHHIAEIRSYNAEQGELVLKQHFHLLNNFDALVRVSTNLQEELRNLRDSEVLNALRDEPEIMAEFDKMEARILLEQNLLERFKSSNAVLRNSMLFLPHAMDELLESLSPATVRRISPQLLRVRKDVDIISADASAIDQLSLQSDLGNFNRVIATVSDGEHAQLALVARHFERLIALEAEADKLMRELTLSGKQDGISDGFAEAFDALYAREEKRSHRYLMLLFVVALAMMSYAIYAFYHMRRLNERTQQALNEAKNQQVALDEHAIVAIIDMQGHITYVNQKMVAISGYWREELLGKDYREIYTGNPDDDVWRGMQLSLSGGRVWHGMISSRSKDGSSYWVEATAVPFMDAQGSAYQYVLICTDITAQKEAEQKLDDSRQRLEEAQSQAHLGNWEADMLSGELLWSDEIYRIFDFDRATFKPSVEAFLAAIHPDDLERVLESERRAEHAGVHDIVHRIIRPSGEVRYVHELAHSEFDAAGRQVRLIGTVQDVTELKRSELAMIEAKEEAEAASKAKGDFLAVMSHEIRTPMNGILGMTDLALETKLSDTQREYLSLVKSSADALLVIINDILDFSKVEAGKMVLEQVPFDIRALSDSTTRLLAVRAAEKDVAVVARLDDDIPAALLGDPGRLRQVLTNLLGNAIKFSHHGEVTLRMKLLEQTGDKARLRIEVADQGIGISPDKLASIFEAFSQADASVTRQYGGTGLGLSIASQLVSAMGGELGVESEIGKGSVFGFEIELPVSSAGAVESGVLVSKPSAPVSMTSLNVLLAEDNAVNQKLAVTLLERWGHRVTVANNGIQALELSGAQTFDVILMDIQMPEMGGFEATRLIREREAREGSFTPIVAMTANAASEDRQRCLDAGMDDYLAKPIIAVQLRDLLQGLSPEATSETTHEVASVTTDISVAFDYAEAITRADPDVVESIGQAFLDSCDQNLDEISAAIAVADGKTLSRSAHTLRGLVGYFNATPVEQLLRQIEDVSERADWQQAGDRYRRLQAKIAQLKMALAAHLASG